MRRRATPAAGESLEHVAQVAHEHAGCRIDVDPGPVECLDLQAAATVPGEGGEQAVVGVLTDTPRIVGAAVGGRVMECGRAIADFPASLRSKNAWAAVSNRPCSSGSTPWPVIAKNPTSRQAWSIAAAVDSRADGSWLAPRSGATSTNGRCGPGSRVGNVLLRYGRVAQLVRALP